MSTQEEFNRWEATLADFIREIGQSVAAGQRQLNENTLAVQREIEEEVASGERTHAVQPPWYQFSEVEADVKLEFSSTLEPTEKGFHRRRLSATPVDPGRRPGGRADLDLSSSLRFKIVPIPPEVRGE